MSESSYKSIGEEMSLDFGTSMGQMFGKPCLKLENKAFAAFFQEAMVFKLGKEEIVFAKQKYIGSLNWDPSGKGRPMKDWLQVPANYEEDWNKLAKQAMEFVKLS